MKKLLLIVSLTVIIAGCASLSQMIQKPVVKAEDVKITDFNFKEVKLDFNLLVNNPNPFGILLEGFDYSFIVEGNEFLKGEETKQLNIQGQNTSSVSIPLAINFNDLYNLVTKTKSLDSLSYRLSGHFKPGGLLAGLDIPYSKSGSLPNVHLPRISLKSLKVNKMGFNGVDLSLGVNLENSNVFGFDIGKLDYKINLGGNDVAKGVTEQLGNVPAKGNGEFVLPISLSFSGLTSSLSTILTGKNVDCTVEGNAGLNSPFGALTLPINTTQNIRIFR